MNHRDVDGLLNTKPGRDFVSVGESRSEDTLNC